MKQNAFMFFTIFGEKIYISLRNRLRHYPAELPTQDQDQEAWEAFKAEHGKQYSCPGEEKLRMKIFLETKKRIDEHNKLAEQGHHTYFQKMYRCGDHLHSELVTPFAC